MELGILSRNIGRFIFLVLLQVLLLNNIHISPLGLTPYIYLLIIILLPFETPGWLILIFSFVLGLSVDAFEDTGGTHAAATLFAGFIRPGLLKLLAPRDGYESGSFPRIYYLGFGWFLKYTFLMIFIHHIVYFTIEIFSFDNFHLTFFKVFLTSIFSLILIVLSQFLIFRK